MNTPGDDDPSPVVFPNRNRYPVVPTHPRISTAAVVGVLLLLAAPSLLAMFLGVWPLLLAMAGVALLLALLRNPGLRLGVLLALLVGGGD